MKRTPFGISPYELAPRLKPVDRICQRWAVSVGAGLVNPEYDPPLKSRPPPLDEETAIVVDTIIMKRCAPVSKRLIETWYRTAAPMEAIEREAIGGYHSRRKRIKLTDWRGRILDKTAYLQMTENGVILCWNLALDELRLRFEQSGHRPLIEVLEVTY